MLLGLPDDLCRVSLHDGLDALPEVRGGLALGGCRVCSNHCVDKSDGLFAWASVILHDEGRDTQVGVSIMFALGCLQCRVPVVLCSGLEEVMLSGQGGGHDGHIHVRVSARHLRSKAKPVVAMVCRGRGCVLFQEAWKSKVVSCVLV